jgi:hypothetical protein
MKRLVIAMATVVALGGSAYSQVSRGGSGAYPRHHEGMTDPGSTRPYYASARSAHYQTTYPGGRGR